MADGVELATAWVRLVPSVEGITQSVQRAVAPAMGPAGKAAGKQFSGGFAGSSTAALGKAGGEGGRRFGSGFKASAGSFMTGALFVAAAAGVSRFVKDSVDALARVETLNAQTEATIKATGGAAGVSAKEVEGLAGKLERLTGTEAESTQEGANLLLTFKNIRNGVGKGNDIFNQATTSLVDMARAMGKDPKTSAVQLGKALNDPIKGVTALSKVGVTFTEDQKEMIKTMVEGGDVAGAQKVILSELNSEFGGSGQAYAKTYAGQMELLGHAFGDVGESIMSAIMPALKNFASAIVPIFQWLSENKPVLIAIASAIGVTLVAALASMTAAVWANTAALLANPITWIVVGIMALIAAVILLVANWDAVVKWVSEIWAGFMAWIREVIDGFVAWWNQIWANIGNFFKSLWNGVINWFKGIWNGIVNWVREKIAFWALVFQMQLKIIKDIWTNIWNGVSGFFKGIWNGIVSWFQQQIAAWQLLFKVGIYVIKQTWENVWNGIKTFFSNIWNGIKHVFQTMMDFVRTKPKAAFEAARDAIGRAWAGIQELARKPVRFVVNTVINGLIGTINKIPGVDIPKVSLPKGFAGGGIIPGYDSVKRDTVLTPMRKGEGVLVPEVVKGLGSDFIHSLNAAGNLGGPSKVKAAFGMGLARGGLVTPLPKGSWNVSQPWHGGHNGLDMAAPMGTKVMAAADGIVGLAGVVPMGGNEVYIQHTNGLGTRYSHLSRFASRAGQTVKQGQIIGYVGSTGMSTGPHLHYMVHNPGRGANSYYPNVNPAGYLNGNVQALGEAWNPLDGLVNTVASQIKKQFPGGGMWIDVAAGIAKDAAKRAVSIFTPKIGADGHTKLYDDGGWMMPGDIGVNKTTKPEPVFTASQWGILQGAMTGLADRTTGAQEGPAVAEFYDLDGVLIGTIDGRIRAAASGGSARALNDVLGTR